MLYLSGLYVDADLQEDTGMYACGFVIEEYGKTLEHQHQRSAKTYNIKKSCTARNPAPLPPHQRQTHPPLGDLQAQSTKL